MIDIFSNKMLNISESLEDAYLMGNRLVKFLSEVLPTHNQYNHLDNIRLRMKSRSDLSQNRPNIQKEAFKIDELCYMNEQKQHQKTKKRDKHVSSDPKMEIHGSEIVENLAKDEDGVTYYE